MSDTLGLVRAGMTLERRAMEIAQLVGSIEFARNPKARKDAVFNAALRHLREVTGPAQRPSEPFAPCSVHDDEGPIDA